ncbi:MAG: DinB family protein [Gemmatimonadales bacterium]|nr:DinB family protein [Gemmatimonadales bacterium]
MSISAAVLPEYDHETSVTRTVLSRVPDEHATWRPHPKSYSLGDLSAHIANLLTWIGPTLSETELDLNPPGGTGWVPPKYESTAALLTTFDANVADGRAAIAGTGDEAFGVPWSLKYGGNVIFTMPRVVVLRSFVLNHLIHHRGQLGVYLRLLDVPVPQIYGPTADEP